MTEVNFRHSTKKENAKKSRCLFHVSIRSQKISLDRLLPRNRSQSRTINTLPPARRQGNVGRSLTTRSVEPECLVSRFLTVAGFKLGRLIHGRIVGGREHVRVVIDVILDLISTGAGLIHIRTATNGKA